MSGLFAGTPLERPPTCERCSKPHAACVCPRGRDGKVLDPRAQAVRVRREKRGGKVVTVAAGFSPRSAKTDDLPAMVGELKKALATGGKAAEDGFEVQGDHRDRVVAWLIERGYPAKAAGG